MISLKSLSNFVILNSALVLLSLFQFAFSTDHFIPLYSSLLLRNYTLINVIESNTKSNQYINREKRIIPIESFPFEFDLFVLSSTLIETITHQFIKDQFYCSSNTSIITLHDFYSFILISFCFEIVFDFFHYVFHYGFHSNKFLYQHIHKVHHKFPNPSCITTFYQHPLDMIITNSLPIYFTYLLLPTKPSYFQFILISTYKVFIEISGHLGKKIKSGSFTQCIWIPKILDIELKVDDHDRHHSLNNCNYSKRFSLYDKIFGTYK